MSAISASKSKPNSPNTLKPKAYTILRRLPPALTQTLPIILDKVNLVIHNIPYQLLEFIVQTQDLEQLASNASDAAALLKAMSNPNRLMVLCALLDTEMSVNELNKLIPLSQSALSQHLSALRKAELVSTRRESQTMFYRIQDEAPLAIIMTLKTLFCP